MLTPIRSLPSPADVTPIIEMSNTWEVWDYQSGNDWASGNNNEWDDQTKTWDEWQSSGAKPWGVAGRAARTVATCKICSEELGSEAFEAKQFVKTKPTCLRCAAEQRSAYEKANTIAMGWVVDANVCDPGDGNERAWDEWDAESQVEDSQQQIADESAREILSRAGVALEPANKKAKFTKVPAPVLTGLHR